MQIPITTNLIACLSVACGAACAQAAPETEAGRMSGWTTVAVPGSPMQIAYPASVFTERQRVDVDGRVFDSRDGRARLVVGTFPNEGGLTKLTDYRTQLLEDNYARASLDYAPTRKSWFVISGTIGTVMFYERVNFSCGGRVINSWALLYPVAEREFYDRVVEAIAPTFRTSAGGCE